MHVSVCVSSACVHNEYVLHDDKHVNLIGHRDNLQQEQHIARQHILSRRGEEGAQAMFGNGSKIFINERLLNHN